MKRKRFEDDPIEVLRAVDPLDPLDVPHDTTGARARALFQEVTSMDTMQQQQTSRPQRPLRNRWVLAGAGLAVVAAAVIGVAVFTGDDTPDQVVAAPTTVGAPTEVPVVGGVPIASAAMCVEFYDLTTLTNRDIAFDGTVASAAGDAVTFTVNNWFTGGSSSEIELNAAGISPGTITSAGPALEIGQRYLVSGSEGNVWSCGFTMTYDTAIAGQWAEAFGG